LHSKFYINACNCTPLSYHFSKKGFAFNIYLTGQTKTKQKRGFFQVKGRHRQVPVINMKC
jgi:hypothetical protein